MKASRGVAALVTLVAAAASAREPNMGGIKVWPRPTYTVYSHDERATRTVLSQVSRIEPALSTLLAHETKPAGSPLYIVVVRSEVWSRYLQPSGLIGAEFVPARFANYLLLTTEEQGSFLRSIINHEYTHAYLRTQFRNDFPLWFDEGMAELMSNTDFRTKSAMIGRPEADYSVGWLPLSRLLRIDKQSPEYLNAQTHLVHRESWAMVHRGLIAEPAFGKQIFAYLEKTKNGVPIDEAVQSSFGMSVTELDRKMKAYSRQSSYRAGTIDYAPPGEMRTKLARELSDQEGLELLARMMFETGLHPERLGEVIAAAEKRAPESAGVRILRLRLAARDRDDAAMESSWRLLEPAAQDPAVARGVGLALYERVRETMSADSLTADARMLVQERAFELLHRSLRAKSRDPEAAWAFGMLAAALKRELESALQFLDAAERDAPMNSDVAMATALVHETRRIEESPLANKEPVNGR